MLTDNASAQTNTNDPFSFLYSYRFALLKTFRKNGLAVATPIWFAHANGNIYFMTVLRTGKVKRIHNNGRATLTPCDQRGRILGDGKEVEGRARELPSSEHAHAEELLGKKYGFVHSLFVGFMKLRRTQRTFVEISPL